MKSQHIIEHMYKGMKFYIFLIPANSKHAKLYADLEFLQDSSIMLIADIKAETSKGLFSTYIAFTKYLVKELGDEFPDFACRLAVEQIEQY